MKHYYRSTIRKTALAALSIATLATGFQSCVKDNFEFDKLADAQFEPNIAAPLVYASLGIENMLKNTSGANGLEIIEGSDKSITVVYRNSVFSIDAKDLVDLPDETLPQFVAPVGASLVPPFNSGSATINQTQTFSLFGGNNPVAPLKVDSLTFKSGRLDFNVNSDLPNKGYIAIAIPSAKKNGKSLADTIFFNSSSPVQSASKSISLSGYTFGMTKGGTTFNTFDVSYKIRLNGSSTPPSPTDVIRFDASMVNMQFSRLFGDIGNHDLSIPADTIDLGMFENSQGGNFSLADPRVKVTISNSYGVPIDFKIPVFKGFSEGVGFYPITGVPNPIPILSPNLGQVGQTLVDSFKLDKNNSNIATIINNTPKQLIYKVDASTNPAGPTKQNFVLDTSHFKMDVEFEIPLDGTVKNLTFIDSIPFSFNEDIPDEVVSGTLRTFNNNGFPIDIDLQVYFTDSLYNKIDSLVNPHQIILKSGKVNSAGRVIASTPTLFDVSINKARLIKLKNAKNIVIVGAASTSNSGNTNVKIYSDYKLDFKLGVQALFRINAK